MIVTLERSALHDALTIPGARAVALLDVTGGATVVWRVGALPLGEQEAATAVALAVAAAGLVALADPADELDDVLVASAAAFHVLRLVGDGTQVAHLTLRREGANLAMARQEFKVLTAAHTDRPAAAATPVPRPPASPPPASPPPASSLAASSPPASPPPEPGRPVSGPPAVSPTLAEQPPTPPPPTPPPEPGAPASGPPAVSPLLVEPSVVEPPLVEPSVAAPPEPESPLAEPSVAAPPEREPSVAEPSGSGAARSGAARSALPRRRPNGAPVAASGPPAPGEADAAAPGWLGMIGQPYLTDECVLDRILVTLRHL